MGLLDDAFRDVASELLGTFSDATMTVTVVTTAYDPRTGVDSSTSEDFVVPVLPGLRTTSENYSAGSVKDTAEMVLLVAQIDLDAVALVLDIGQVVSVDGVAYTVIELEPVYSGNQIALVRIFANRG